MAQGSDLVMDLIHCIDVVEQLQRVLLQRGQWVWQRQLRYCGEGRGGGVQVRMDNRAFAYSFQYQGNAPRLVYTPLTDKCCLTLTQGMHMGTAVTLRTSGNGKDRICQGAGSGYGPAGSGVQLRRGVRLQVHGKIFTGLLSAARGVALTSSIVWRREVLSAVSSQFRPSKRTQVAAGFDDLSRERHRVNQNAGIFVTLNPAGKGYGGRSKLPDNLKQLFRSVAMTVPNFELIAEVILLSEGFRNARILGGKLVSLFSLSKQLLSPQQHYDWGLRALKTVLKLSRKTPPRRAHGRCCGAGPRGQGMEAQIVIEPRRSRRSRSSRSRTVAVRRPAQRRLPRRGGERRGRRELEAAIQEVLEGKHENVPSQIEKVLQLHIACSQRQHHHRWPLGFRQVVAVAYTGGCV